MESVHGRKRNDDYVGVSEERIKIVVDDDDTPAALFYEVSSLHFSEALNTKYTEENCVLTTIRAHEDDNDGMAVCSLQCSNKKKERRPDRVGACRISLL
jgi:hypothetical protein